MIRCVNCNISILRKEEIEYMKCRNCSKKWNSIGGIRVKNYIEEATKKLLNDYNLKINERFMLNDEKFYFCNSYVLREDNDEAVSALKLNRTLSGIDKIEKIKPKTLMEQLKAQGFGWCVYATGRIECKYFEWSEFEYLTYQGNISLTKSEAERESYRQKLEFEMKEWARENDCLGDSYRDINPFAAFLCHIKEPVGEQSKVDEFREKFRNKANKYYKWEE